jgi:hypothetical protein
MHEGTLSDAACVPHNLSNNRTANSVAQLQAHCRTHLMRRVCFATNAYATCPPTPCLTRPVLWCVPTSIQVLLLVTGMKVPSLMQPVCYLNLPSQLQLRLNISRTASPT